MLSPKRVKHRKVHRGRMRGFSKGGMYSTGIGDTNDGIEIPAIQLTSC